MILTDRETFLIVFAEGKNVPERLLWTLKNLEALGIKLSNQDVAELIQEYDHLQLDLIDICKSRRILLEKLQQDGIIT